jgi:sugar/nucleoside kinase (ribokinase family)
MKHLKLFEHFPVDLAEDIPEDEGIHRVMIVGGQDEYGNDIMIMIEGSEDNEELPPAELDEWVDHLTNVTLEEFSVETIDDMLELIDAIQEDLEYIQENGYTVKFSWKEWENMDMIELRNHIDQALDQGNKDKFDRLVKRLK